MTAAVRIERLAAGGDGVGHLDDGRAVFVPRTAPGDLAELAEVRLAARFARARLGRLVEPGPDRVEPRCRHYGADLCGGCQWQHLAPDAQRRARGRIIGDALRRIGRLDVADPEVVAAPADWGYRTRITLAVRAGGRRIGFHVQGQPDRVFDLAGCDIARPELVRLWQAVSAERRLLPRGATALTLRLDRDGGPHLLVEDGGPEAWAGGPALGAALDRRGARATIWWRAAGGAARVMAGAADPFPATVFEQVNPAMGDLIREAAIAELGVAAGTHAWDLYAGIGEATARLVALGATVESVEADRRAVQQAERTPAPAAIRHAGRAEDLVARLRDPDRVLANPPRAGMDERVVAELRRRRPPRVAYVSCDPATLARDLGRLSEGGYRLRFLRGFDLFPQTAHVETVAVMEAA